jgi:hypothetical protein
VSPLRIKIPRREVFNSGVKGLNNKLISSMDKLQETRSTVLQSLTMLGKAIPLQALTGPEVSRRLRLPDFKKIGT